MNRSKVGYANNIEKETLSNDYFRKVIYTGANMQLVVMSLKPGEDIGMEVHEDHDQFFRIEEGVVTVYMDGEETELNADDVVIVPAGTEHNVTNTGNVPVKLYTIYAPPEHPDGRLDENKPHIK
ncbi:cupin domain-containing protein [Candidatus Dojkabacteria bacterium]|uniref:Cupin domain-containing protein n=1 Tax=Candidatus Dojkabacteria bacterium TaxID=2099670 RepID=A0A955RLN9_9BACT|nr:cupin domain-containing protein [Candidatus Dojkabacteria bacterium]